MNAERQGDAGDAPHTSAEASGCNNSSACNNSTGAGMERRVSNLEREVAEIKEMVAELVDDGDERDKRFDAISRKTDGLADRVAELEDEVAAGKEDQDSRQSNESVCMQDELETPLEEIVELPEPVADRELSANQLRARFVAQDIVGYTKSIPKGRSITTSDLRRVLRAGTDCNGHSETVQRVAQIIDDLGKGSVEIVDRRGQRRVVFDQELVDRLQERTRRVDHDVVIGQTA